MLYLGQLYKCRFHFCRLLLDVTVLLFQSCPWVGLTRGLGWVGGGCQNFVLGWIMGLKWQISEKKARRVHPTFNQASTRKFVLQFGALFLWQVNCCSMGMGHGLGHGSISSVGLCCVWSVIWMVGLGWVDENRPIDDSVLFLFVFMAKEMKQWNYRPTDMSCLSVSSSTSVTPVESNWTSCAKCGSFTNKLSFNFWIRFSSFSSSNWRTCNSDNQLCSN